VGAQRAAGAGVFGVEEKPACKTKILKLILFLVHEYINPHPSTPMQRFDRSRMFTHERPQVVVM